jgi:putative transposase
MERYKSNKNVVYSSKYHVVWCPKYRRTVLEGSIPSRLRQVLYEIAKDREAEIIELEIMPDHVHILVMDEFLFCFYGRRSSIVHC